MSHDGTYTKCPVCGATAHDCGNGDIYCGEADVTMTGEQVEQALAARDIARRVIDGATLHQAVTAREAEVRAEVRAEVEQRGATL